MGIAEQVERQLIERGLPLPWPSSRFRGVAHPLDALEQRVAFLVTQRVAQQRAEQPDVVAERLVRIVGRRRSLGFDGRMHGGESVSLFTVWFRRAQALWPQQKITRSRRTKNRLTGEQEFRSLISLSRVEPVELRLRDRGGQ